MKKFICAFCNKEFEYWDTANPRIFCNRRCSTAARKKKYEENRKFRKALGESDDKIGRFL